DVLDGDMRDSGPTVIRNEAEGCEAEECGAEGCEAEECRAEGCEAEGYEAEGYEAEGCRAEGCEAEGCRAEGCEAEECGAEGCEAEECEAEGCGAEDALSGTPDGGEEEWTWLPPLSPRECADKILADLSVIKASCRNLILVSDDVFRDGIRYGRETEDYRELLGILHREIAAGTNAWEGFETVEVTCGIPLRPDIAGKSLDDNIGEKRREGMVLIIGGAYQGKLNYAKGLFPDYPVINGETEELPDKGDFLFPAFDAWFQRRLLEGGEPEKEALALMRSGSRPVIIAEEVGSGIVPMDAGQREYRERLGRCLTDLALGCQQVYRVFAGLGCRIS
ncbi:MAG: bifunctional adenosylcobinamide kinase/adenosylcobinamide-phosphate guanylyltransferase, partial [Lachnospiraceae bacterium]|nr:bifunctional adenosylcobinamide kinase/adenosylcobinamide-phosphate guanylyltransferase [Lachnospiraceae bacterium]